GLLRVAGRKRAEAVSFEHQEADAALALPGSARESSLTLLHLAVPHVRLVADVLETLSLGQAPDVPIAAILPHGGEHDVGHRLPEVDPVVTPEELGVLRGRLPLPRPG